MKSLLLCALLLFSTEAFGQQDRAEYPEFYGLTLAEVVDNEDWRVIKKATGYLSFNQVEATVLVLQSGSHEFVSCSESADLLRNEERIILVLTSREGEPKVIIQNNKFIARPNDSGMMCYIEPELVIEDNQLTILYQFTRSNRQYTFEYSEGEIILVSAKSVGVSGGKLYSDFYDFRRKVIESEEGSIGSDSSTQETIPIEFDGFKTLSEFGEMNEWEVAEYKFL
jgi:hypothetical protein